MSTPTSNPPTPKGPRNNNNNRRPLPKKNITPHTQNMALLTTPPSSPPRNTTPAGAATDSSNPNNVNLQSKKKPPRSGKKPKDVNRSESAPNGHNGASGANGSNGHRRTSSRTNASNVTPQQAKDSAYAGPTFHASPAPSQLPMPSFFSKSLPESDLATTLETDSDTADTEGEVETTPSKPRARPSQQLADGEREREPQSTPLDFLFKAAVQARNSNSMSSPELSNRVRLPQTEPRLPHSNLPGGMFSFEMGSENARGSNIGPSFAPSYQDRMTAFRSSSSPPTQNPETEEQRRAKNAELKQLLLNPRPQRSSPTSPAPEHPASQYGARPHVNPSLPPYATPSRTNSGPPAPINRGYSPQVPQVPNQAGYQYPYANGHQVRNTESPLRREVPPNHYHAPFAGPYGNPYMGRASVPAFNDSTNYISPQPQYATAAFTLPTHSPSPSRAVDTRQMEADLRRILKMDATSEIQSSRV
ncbi:hypothetical protein N7454_000337 [Penicillium verhagenii]|nr:hypothetical protein N7454_000337 [Penicillium verhagenii]